MRLRSKRMQRAACMQRSARAAAERAELTDATCAPPDALWSTDAAGACDTALEAPPAAPTDGVILSIKPPEDADASAPSGIASASSAGAPAAGASRAAGHASSVSRAVMMRASIETLGSDAVVLELAAALE